MAEPDLDTRPAAGGSQRRDAHLYLLGLAASFLGGSAMVLTAGIWVKSLTGDSGLAAVVSACVYVPSMFGPVAGLITDRVRRRPLLIAVNWGSAIAVLSLVLVRSAEQVWLVCAVMTCYGVARVLIDPAEQGLFVTMLSAPERRRLNGMRMVVQEGGKLAAPAIGAGVFAMSGGSTVAVITAAAFAVAAVCVTGLRVRESRPTPARTRLWGELTAGFRYLFGRDELRVSALGAAVAVSASGVVVAPQFSLADALGRPPSFVGVLTGLLGAGSLVAGITSARLVRRYGEVRLLLVGLVNSCLGYLLLATTALPLVLAGSFVRGFALPWVVIALVNLSQRSTPTHLQGRVASVINLLLFAPQPLAQLGGAAALALLGSAAGIHALIALVSAVSAVWVGVALHRRRSG